MRPPARTLAACALSIATACSSTPDTPDPRDAEIGVREGNPLPGARLYVDPESPALATAQAWRFTRPADAAVLERIARVPQAVWIAPWSGDPKIAVQDVIADAERTGTLPVFVAYNIVGRDCGEFAAGGEETATGYRSWIRSFALGLGSHKAVVILEPDAVGDFDCLQGAQLEERIQLLRDAVHVLKAQPRTYVYIDAGNPGWLEPEEAADRLKQVDIARADGFALNVSNFETNEDNVEYGHTISALVGGKHFIIDTSRNALGPAPEDDWCNPPGRGLGIPSTTRSGDPLVDALIWVKRPGESDGPCHGGPEAGEWWPEYALDLASRWTTDTSLLPRSVAVSAEKEP